jgi:Uncharacterized protein conserved in bacteria (DUF2213)
MILHPGARVALSRFSADELGVARLMAAGEVSGPQDVGGFTMFVVRVTGTGLAYRAAEVDEKGRVRRAEEYVWRDSSLYLNEDFLARCNGLPLVWQHPAEKPRLDHDEFHDRMVGTVFLPFVRGDEVWAVVKVWDEPAARLMREEKLSTSPSVMVRVRGGDKLRLPGGAALLDEPRPFLLDHLAVCEVGVWDKGGEASGIEGEEPRHDAVFHNDSPFENDTLAAFSYSLRAVYSACTEHDAMTEVLDLAERIGARAGPR